jgi:GTP pyrophosphokinase
MSSRFEGAVTYPARPHASQLRKDGSIPYIAPLLGVVSIALQYGTNENEAIAALLHDATKDQGGAATLEKIRSRFRDEVAEIADGCTFPKPLWKIRKEAYVAGIRNATLSVRPMSACDKSQNARAILAAYRTLGDLLGRCFSGGKERTLWYYRALVEVSREAGASPRSRDWLAWSLRLSA